MFKRHRNPGLERAGSVRVPDIEMIDPSETQGEKPAHHMHMPVFNHNGHKVTRGIKPEGESGRAWIHPWHFLRICFRSTSHASMAVNGLWPFVPAAIAIHFARPDLNLWSFILNYIAMVPTANLIGFAGQELARKLPKVFGTLVSCLFGELLPNLIFCARHVTRSKAQY